MPNRGAGGVSYRYGFNGKETENDVKGIGNEQDYGMRIYDPRLGRFLSVDPISKRFPSLTPYQFAGNNSIFNVDLDGKEPKSFINQWITKPLYDLGSKQKLNGNGDNTITIEDPKLGYIDARLIYDNWEEKHYFVHDDDQGNHYYLKNDNGSSDVLTLKGGTIKVTGGHFEPFETQNQIQARYGIALADGFATGGAIAVAAPFLLAGAVNLGSAAFSAVAEYSPIVASIIKRQAINIAVRGIATYYKYLPIAIKSGNMIAEFLDESGQFGNVNSGVTSARTLIDQSRVQHIFRNAIGHLFADTPESRKLLEDVANDAGNLLGGDKYGNSWYAKITKEGSQIWTQVRNGKIINGGINETPRTFNAETGLSASKSP